MIEAGGLDHWQLQQLLKEMGSEYGDKPYHTELRWLGMSTFFELSKVDVITYV